MKPEKLYQDDPAVNQLLRVWKLDASLPLRFHEQVWQRIKRAEQTTAAPSKVLRNWLAQTFARPAVALGYLAVLLLAGSLAGSWQAHLASERTAASLRARYVQMVDPYQMPRR